jgi:hypothetical protein
MKSESDAIAFSGSAKFADVGASSKDPLAASDDDGSWWIGGEVESDRFDAG